MPLSNPPKQSTHQHQISDIATLADVLNGKASAADITLLATAIANRPALDANGNLPLTGRLIISNTTQATSSTTGAVTIAGGIGVGGNSYLAGDVKIGISGTSKLGFFGATPSGKPSVTGSRGGNVALGTLLSALANLGVITNNTTA